MNDDTRQRDDMKDRTDTENRPAHPSTTTKLHGEVRHGYGTQAEKESSRGTQLEDIFSFENLSRAWKQVCGNKGAAGVGGMEVGDFPDFHAKHWEMIHRKLMEGSYSPSPVRRVMIRKAKGQYPPPWHSDGIGSPDSASHRTSPHATIRSRLQ